MGMIKLYLEGLERQFSGEQACCSSMRTKAWVPSTHGTGCARVVETEIPLGLLSSQPSQSVSFRFDE